jgi:putative ABC transport system permease protein
MSAAVSVRYGLALRLALRELRGGVRGFGVFLACLALGVGAIAGVGLLSRALSDGLAREGGVILGGDISFSLAHREASSEELEFLQSRGRVSKIATMRAMARSNGAATLVELKAADPRYPLAGAVQLNPAMPMETALARKDNVFSAVAEPALLVRLNLSHGDRIVIGDGTFVIFATLESEPDKLAAGIGLGPRLIVSEEGLRATGLLQPGSLVRWTYRVRLNDASEGSLIAMTEASHSRFPEAGWEVRTRTGAAPRLEKNVKRFAEYLTLVGLTALLVGGVGVANAVKHYLDRKRGSIATLKAVGASGGTVFRIYLAEIMLIALAGITIGLVIGSALPFAVEWVFGKVIPIPIVPAIHADVLLLATVYGFIIALAFALWPLGRSHDVPVSALFRDMVDPGRQWPRRRYIFFALAAIVGLIALTILTAEVRRVAIIYVVAATAVFILLRVLAIGLMALARRLPRPRTITLKLALANIHRPGALTPSVVLSLGLGLSLLVTLVLIESNLRRQLTASLPERAPSFFFLDIHSNETADFEKFVRSHASEARLDQVPMLRGRIVRLNGVSAEQVKPDPEAAWVLQSDRGITYAEDIPNGSRLAEGEWWPKDYAGPPLVSIEKRIADGLGLKIGDTIAVNVLGRVLEAKVQNLRTIEWESLGINFVLLFSPNTFRGAPHTSLATLTYAKAASAQTELNLLKDVANQFPAVTTVRVKEALAIRGTSTITLLASVLVLAGALAAGHHSRVYDAVILKTLGARRRTLITAYAIEYAILGLATALVAAVAGGIAASYVVQNVMRFRFEFDPWAALLAALVAVVLTVVFGLLGTWRALGEKPVKILRNL